MQILKTISRLSRKGPDVLLKGALLTPFNKSGEGLPFHQLDTHSHEYYRLLNEVVIPDCMTVAADTKNYPHRIYELMSYVIPAFTERWSFGVELTYRMVATTEHQTEKNLMKARLLRIAVDMMFSMASVLDDVVDNSSIRRSKKSWHLICPGGSGAALCDSAVLSYLPFRILTVHFKSDPGYSIMMEKVAEANIKALIGQTIDAVERDKNPTAMDYLDISSYKAGHAMAAQPMLGAIHAGVQEKEVLDQMGDVFKMFGRLFQIWDDFQDYFNLPGKTGKPSCDFHNAGVTWVSSSAVQHFDDKQKQIFEECYGSAEPEKVEAVKTLYDAIDVPRMYLKELRKYYLEISEMIERLPEQRYKDPLYSYMDWLVGDLADPHYDETKSKFGL